MREEVPGFGPNVGGLLLGVCRDGAMVGSVNVRKGFGLDRCMTGRGLGWVGLYQEGVGDGTWYAGKVFGIIS